MRTAYLELRQTSPTAYDVLWKVPGRGYTWKLRLSIALPVNCVETTAPGATLHNSLYIERRNVNCAGSAASTS